MQAEDDVGSFESAAEEYDAARPSYPDALYDLIESRAGPLAGRLVLDGGAGTGIASRQLLARGAWVVAVDPGLEMLLRARRRSAALPLVVGDAARAPARGGWFEVACFAQSWHWVDQEAGAAEAARLLRPSGWWAAWWSHPWADGRPWFDRYYSLLENRCAGVSREQRDIEAFGRAVTASSSFGDAEQHAVPWQRTVSVDDWVVDLTSHSYVIALPPSDRSQLLAEVRQILVGEFPDGRMTVPYETRLLLAQRAGGDRGSEA